MAHFKLNDGRVIEVDDDEVRDLVIAGSGEEVDGPAKQNPNDAVLKAFLTKNKEGTEYDNDKITARRMKASEKTPAHEWGAIQSYIKTIQSAVDTDKAQIQQYPDEQRFKTALSNDMKSLNDLMIEADAFKKKYPDIEIRFIGEFSNDPTEIAAAYASQRKIPLEEATELLAKFPDVVKGQLSNPEASTSTRVSQGLTSGATLPLRGAFAAGSSLSDLMKGKTFAESGENAVQGMSSTEGFKGGVQNDPVILASMALPMVGAAKAAQIASKLPKFISPTAVRAASGAVGQGGLAGTRQIMRDVNEQPVEGSPMGDILTSAAIGGTVPVAGEYISKMLKEGASNRAFNNPNLSDLVGLTGKGTEQRLLNKQSDISKNMAVPEDIVDFNTYNNLLMNAKTPKLRNDAEQFLKSGLVNNLTLENENARRAGMSFENFNAAKKSIAELKDRLTYTAPENVKDEYKLWVAANPIGSTAPGMQKFVTSASTPSRELAKNLTANDAEIMASRYNKPRESMDLIGLFTSPLTKAYTPQVSHLYDLAIKGFNIGSKTVPSYMNRPLSPKEKSGKTEENFGIPFRQKLAKSRNEEY